MKIQLPRISRQLHQMVKTTKPNTIIWMQLLQQATVLIHTEPQRAIAKSFAESEFEKYRIVQDKLFERDFDKAIKKLDAPKMKND